MIQEQIEQMPEYQQAAAERQGQRQGQRQGGQTGVAVGGTAGGSVFTLEKTDVQFWLDVAKVVLLWMILRELQRGP